MHLGGTGPESYPMASAGPTEPTSACGTPTLVDEVATGMLPADFTSNPIIYPDESLLSPLEFGAAVTLTDENRAELWARVKSS